MFIHGGKNLATMPRDLAYITVLRIRYSIVRDSTIASFGQNFRGKSIRTRMISIPISTRRRRLVPGIEFHSIHSIPRRKEE